MLNEILILKIATSESLRGVATRSNPIHAMEIASSGCGPPRNDIFMGRGAALGM
jgi:hypothetical protein